MSLYPVAGCKIYIGNAPLDDKATDFVASDFAAVTWTAIDGWEQMGSFGDTAQVITTSLINRGRDIKQKGTRNAGSMQNVFAIVPADAGQIALIAAEKTVRNYPFKVELNDAPVGDAPTPSTRLFVGLVTSAQEAGGEANTIQKLNATIEINSNIVHVAAATGDD